VKKFAEENKLDFRQTGEWELLKLNIDNYKRVATLEPAPGFFSFSSSFVLFFSCFFGRS
jgi:hypothetical protein